MTDARAWIAAVEEYIAAATRGPWVVVDDGEGVEAAPDGGPDDWMDADDEPRGPNVAQAWDAGPFAADSAFMAGARTDLPRALGALRAVLELCDGADLQDGQGGTPAGRAHLTTGELRAAITAALD